MCYKAGGGVTSQSVCRKEYEEVIRKVYLPLNFFNFVTSYHTPYV